MKPLRIAGAVGCAVAIAASVFARDQPADSTSQDLLFLVRHSSASNIAEMLQNSFGSNAGVSVATEHVSNAVFVQAPPDQMPRIKDLLTVLDLPPAVIEVDVTILRTDPAAEKQATVAELSGDSGTVNATITALEQAGAVQVIDRLHLTTLDNQIAQIQFGQKSVLPASSKTSAAADRAGQEHAPFSANKVGTTLTVTPRRTGDDVVAEFAVEKSWLQDGTFSNDGGASVQPPTEQLSVRATLRLPKGRSVFLGGSDSAIKEGRSRTAVIAAARVVGPGANSEAVQR